MFRPRRILIAGLCAWLSCLALVPSHAAPAAEFVPGELVVKFRPQADPGGRAAILQDLGAQTVRRFDLTSAELVRVSGLGVEQAVARYAEHPDIAYIEPNYIYRAETVPDDPLFPNLWGMQNTGQTGGLPGADISAANAWSVFTGSAGVLLAIIDTGVDYGHPDLAANIYVNPGEVPNNGLDDDGNGYVDDVRGWDFANGDNDPMDDNGHGTHVAGTCGAIGNNGIGVAGVNWTVRLLPIKFLSGGGSGTLEAAIQSIDYATRMGAVVTNNSWGGYGYSAGLRDAIARADSAGVMFVAAAGNDALNTDVSPHYPSSYDLPNIVSVAATNHFDQLAWFSNFGPTSVDLAAPGENIVSTFPGAGYGSLSGTSMATPHVAGAAALMRGFNPGADMPAIRELLLANVDPLASLAGSVLTGGRLDVFAALGDTDTVAPATVADLGVAALEGSWLVLSWTAPGDDGASGTAHRYDVRSSTAPITPENFDAATPVPGAPQPQPAGATESLRVDGLAFSSAYHFALRAYDEHGNAGGLSNVASAVTLPPPDIAVAPASLSADLLTGLTATRTLTVSNAGSSSLAFEITVESASGPGPVIESFGPAAAGGAVLARGVEVPLSQIASSGLPAQLSLPQETDRAAAGTLSAPPPGGGHLALSPTTEVFGGPQNLFLGGYRSRGNLFQCTTARSLREHRFYVGPQAATQMWFLVYEGSNATGTYQIVSASNVTPAGPGPGWYSSGPVDVALLEGRYYLIVCAFEQTSEYYNQLGIFPYPIPASFGSLIGGAGWMWSPATSFPPPATQMVPPDAFGDQVAYYQTLVTDQGATWVSLAPESGFVAPGEALEVAVTFDASGLYGGDYTADVHVRSNDPDEPDVVVPATLHVTGAADVAVTPAALDFGGLFLGLSKADSVVVRNSGTDDLHVSGVTLTPGPFTAPDAGFVLGPGGEQVLPVVFTPVAPGVAAATLTVHSDDVDEPSVTVSLSGEGLVPPDIAVSPGSLSADLLTGQSAGRTLTIANTGGSDLAYRIEGARVAGAPVAQHPPVTLVKGEPDGRIGGPVTLGRGGPDQFGYEWMDSDEPGGPAFSWIPIDAIGMPVPLYGDDGNYGPLPIGFSFPFYGQEFTTFRVCTNGWISFTSGSSTFSNQPLPSAGAPENLIAAFWADLYVDPNEIRYWSDGDRLVVQYTNVSYLGTTAPLTFQIVLHRGGRILFQYLAMTPPVNWMAAGIQNATQDDGLTVAFNTPYVHDGLAVRIAAGPTWLAAAPAEGVVPPGGTADVAVGIDATGLIGGDYAANLEVRSNDPDEPVSAVPVALRVTGAPDMRVEPAAIDFGTLFVGQTRADSVVVRNVGSDLLSVSAVSATPSVFGAPSSGFALAPGASRVLPVSFAPANAGAVSGALTVQGDDPDQPAATVALSGLALDPPDVAVTPGALSADLFTGEQTTRTLTISNTGASDLEFAIRMQRAEPVPSATAAAQSAATGPRTRPDRGAAWPGTGTDVVTPAPHQTPGERPAFSGDPGAAVAPYPFSEDFEDGNADGWLTGGYGGREVTQTTAAAGTRYSYHEFNSSGGHMSGAYQRLPAVRPAYVGFWVRSGSVATHDGYFVLWDQSGYDAIWFFMQGNGFLYVNGAEFGGGDVAPYEANRWYHVEFRNIDFAARTFDVHVDDVRVREGVLFRNSWVVDDFGRLDIYNYSYGAEAWWDEIDIADQPPAGWLSATPVTGTVPAGSSVDVEVGFDATGLFGGDYFADLVVATNDPDESEVRVPTHLHVTGAPDIDVAPLALDFDSLFIGLSRTDTIVVRNTGTDVLVVTSVAAAPASYSAPAAGFALAPGAAETLVVTFAPLEAGSLPGTLTVRSNDADEGEAVVALSGVGVVPPDVSVVPSSLEASLPPGEATTRTLTVRNDGGSDLAFGVALQFGTAAAAPPADAQGRIPDTRADGIGRAGPSGPSGLEALLAARLGSIAPEYVRFHEDFESGPNGWTTRVLSGPPLWHATQRSYNSPTHAWWCGDEATGNYNFGLVQTMAVSPVIDLQGTLPPVTLQFFEWFDTEPGWDYCIVDVSTDGGATWTHLRGGRGTAPAGSSGGWRMTQLDLSLFAGHQIQLGFFLDTGDGIANSYPGWYFDDVLVTTATPPWLVVAPAAGVVRPGEALALTATFDADGLEVGDYVATATVLSNDPDEPAVAVPASLHVRDLPMLRMRPDTLDFGEVFAGWPRALPVVLANVGGEPLVVSALATTAGVFTVTPAAPIAIAPHDSVVAVVVFSPTGAGAASGQLVATSNGIGSPDSVALAGAGVLPPEIAVAPEAIVAVAPPGGVAHRVLRVSNRGPGPLTFETTLLRAPGAGQPAAAAAVAAAGAPAGAMPRLDASGGPDAFGHTWTDSDDPDGPVFAWTDIRDTGELLPFPSFADDHTLGPLPIGFPFPFYADTFQTFHIGVNGCLSFSSPPWNGTNRALPTQEAGVAANLVAALWDNQILAGYLGAAVHVLREPDRMIVQYTNLVHSGQTQPPYHTYQAILERNGSITFQYLQLGIAAGTATVGIQNGSRDDGLTVVHDAPYLRDGLAVRIDPALPWAGVTPAEAVVPPGGFVDLDLAFSAAGLAEGRHDGRLRIASNDPAQPQLFVPLEFHVAQPVVVEFDLKPERVRLCSRHMPKRVHGFIEPPPPYTPADIDVASLRLNGVVPPDLSVAPEVGDRDHDGRPDLKVHFSRTALDLVLPPGLQVPVAITGMLGATREFVGHDTVRVKRGRIRHPHHQDVLEPGQVLPLAYDVSDASVRWVALMYSPNGGASWTMQMTQIPNTGTFDWRVPNQLTDSALVSVVEVEEGALGVEDVEGVLAVSESFSIQGTLDAPRVAAAAGLLPPRPNPSAGPVRIAFTLARAGEAEVAVFDLQGRQVATPLAGMREAGNHEVVWDGRWQNGDRAEAGLYFVRLRTAGQEWRERLVRIE